MVVHNFASFKVFVIKVAHNELNLGNSRQELLFSNLGVLATAFSHLFQMLVSFGFHFVDSLLSQRMHDLVVIEI